MIECQRNLKGERVAIIALVKELTQLEYHLCVSFYASLRAATPEQNRVVVCRQRVVRVTSYRFSSWRINLIFGCATQLCY